MWKVEHAFALLAKNWNSVIKKQAIKVEKEKKVTTET